MKRSLIILMMVFTIVIIACDNKSSSNYTDLNDSICGIVVDDEYEYDDSEEDADNEIVEDDEYEYDDSEEDADNKEEEEDEHEYDESEDDAGNEVYNPNPHLAAELYGKILPYTWDAPMPMGGVMRTTINEDGTTTGEIITPCVNCMGTGYCGACNGRGGMYYGTEMLSLCGACGGGGICRACYGKGQTIIKTHTGIDNVTTGIDEKGNVYIAYPEEISVNRQICAVCKGDRTCHVCNATGKVLSEASLGSDKEIYKNCPSCRGSRKCSACNGTGKI